MPSMMIAQITDTHVKAAPDRDPNADASARLLKVIRALNATTPAPDVVLVTGDLTADGDRPDYDHLRALLSQLNAPYFIVPGNHDDREAIRAIFRQDGYLPETGYLNYVVEGYPLRLVGLDTLNEGHDGGRLCLDRLYWLETALEQARDKPTVLFMHHPPFLSGISPFDRSPMEGADALASILSGNPQVERVLCGHLHRPVTTHLRGVTVSAAPSTAFEIALDMGSDADFQLVPGAAPGYQLHLWTRAGGLVTHTISV